MAKQISNEVKSGKPFKSSYSYRQAVKFEWPFEVTDFKSSFQWKLRRSIIIPAVGLFSKIVLGIMNRPFILNKKVMEDAIDNRPNFQPLLTYSNHYSCIDDPVIWGMLSWKYLFTPSYMRWILTAHDICFTNKLLTFFFSSGQCIPVIRGYGVYQKAVDFCINRLNNGDWVHIFPEGGVNSLKKEMRFKWGIGRLICESNITPIVIPIYHKGMDTLLPNVKPYYPRAFKKVDIVVGNPIDLHDTLAEMRRNNLPAKYQRKKITDILQDEFYRLKNSYSDIPCQGAT